MDVTGYAIIIIAILRLPLKKAPKIFSYALWAAAFVRLICPLSFVSVFSLIYPKLLTIPAKLINENPAPTSTTAIEYHAANAVTAPPPTAPVAFEPPIVNTFPTPTAITLASWIWITGIAVLLIYSVFTVIKLHRNLKHATHIHSNIFEIDGISTPFVFGALRPKIFLPSNLSVKEHEYIILHEQAHIERFDHIIKSLTFLILCIHWYNPLVWIAYSLMNTDMEMSVDEKVIRQLGTSIKKDYSSSLLSLSARKRIVGGCPLAFGEDTTKERIMNILNYKRPAFWIVIVSIFAVIAISMGLITDPLDGKMTERDYADRLIKNEISAMYGDAKWADFKNVEIEITNFEMLDRFDDILESPVEIWHLEYRFKPENINEAALGNVNYADGWILEDDTMGFKALAFSYEKSYPNYLGSLFSVDGLNGNVETVAGRETLLRVYLEQNGLLQRETYKSDHVIVKFPLSTGETCQLFLSQPAKIGSGGIWCTERWMDGNGTIYYDIPSTDGRITEYYSLLQKECDNGHKPYLLDPVQVALEYINGEKGIGQSVSIDLLEIINDATIKEFLQTPMSHYIGFISNFTLDDMTKPYFHLDRIEWLTIEDTKRLNDLGIDPDDLPNGFYIYNPANYPAYFQCYHDTEFLIIDYIPGDHGVSHKSVSVTEFAEYLEQFNDFIPPFHVYTRDGHVQTVEEQYVP